MKPVNSRPRPGRNNWPTRRPRYRRRRLPARRMPKPPPPGAPRRSGMRSSRPAGPRHDAPPPATATGYRVQQPIIGDPDPARLRAAQERESTFVLITNLPAAECDARRLVGEYKGETVIEQRFHFMKDPAFVDAVFVHKQP